eukprot:403334361
MNYQHRNQSQQFQHYNSNYTSHFDYQNPIYQRGQYQRFQNEGNYYGQEKYWNSEQNYTQEYRNEESYYTNRNDKYYHHNQSNNYHKQQQHYKNSNGQQYYKHQKGKYWKNKEARLQTPVFNDQENNSGIEKQKSQNNSNQLQSQIEPFRETVNNETFQSRAVKQEQASSITFLPQQHADDSLNLTLNDSNASIMPILTQMQPNQPANSIENCHFKNNVIPTFVLPSFNPSFVNSPFGSAHKANDHDATFSPSYKNQINAEQQTQSFGQTSKQIDDTLERIQKTPNQQVNSQNLNERQEEKSMFTTPKPESQFRSCQHFSTLNCLRTCSTWSLAIKFNQDKAIKIKHTQIAVQQLGCIKSGPLPFLNDIIDAYILKETANLSSQTPQSMVFNSKSQEPNLNEFNLLSSNGSSEDYENVQANPKIKLPFNNTEFFLNPKCEDILIEQKSEHMMCLEFDLSSIFIPQDYFAESQLFDTHLTQVSPRVVNQSMVESTFHYYINGECHGQRILLSDLHYQLQGKKIVKSIQQRITDYKELIQNQVQQKLLQLTHCDDNCKQFTQDYMGINYPAQICPNHPRPVPLTNNFRFNLNMLRQLNEQGYGPFLERPSTLNCKMLNIPKSVAIEFQYSKLPSIENFLTNFNQLVMQNGIINKIRVCFDLPMSKMLKDEAYQTSNIVFTPPMRNTPTYIPTSLIHQLSETKPMNLLDEFQKIKQPEINDLYSTRYPFSRTISFASQSSESSLHTNYQQQQNQQRYNQLNVNAGQFHKQFSNNMKSGSGQGSQTFTYQPYQITQIPSSDYIANSANLSVGQNQMPNQLISDSQIYQLHPNFKRNLPQNFQHQQPHKYNLEIMLNSLSPQFQDSLTIDEFFEQFKESSIFGAKIKVYNQVEEQSEVVVMIPTLSSIYLSYQEKVTIPPAEIKEEQKVDSVFSIEMRQKYEQNQEKDVFSIFPNSVYPKFDNQTIDQLSQLQQTKNHLKHRIFEYHEDQPIYNRHPLALQLHNLFNEHVGSHPNLRDIMVSTSWNSSNGNVREVPQATLNQERSWFSVVWTPLKSIPLNKDISMPASQNILQQQFLMVYSFLPSSTNPSLVSLVGLIPLKDSSEHLDFWIQPVISDTAYDQNHSTMNQSINGMIINQNNFGNTSNNSKQLQREYRKNKDRVLDLKDAAVEFLENQNAKCYDYNFFVNQSLSFYDISTLI